MRLLSHPDKCYFCGYHREIGKRGKYRNSIEIHHIIEKNKGGDNSEYNLVTCCSLCHSKIHEGDIIIDRWYFSTKGWVLFYSHK